MADQLVDLGSYSPSPVLSHCLIHVVIVLYVRSFPINQCSVNALDTIRCCVILLPTIHPVPHTCVYVTQWPFYGLPSLLVSKQKPGKLLKDSCCSDVIALSETSGMTQVATLPSESPLTNS